MNATNRNPTLLMLCEKCLVISDLQSFQDRISKHVFILASLNVFCEDKETATRASLCCLRAGAMLVLYLAAPDCCALAL